ncbi:MAG: hypothetical protein JW919_03220 [Candidatus Omnitrophica bacterium]|nr:hypothetical protein [Candidatus Omnitrophota bacterium]
MEWKKLADSVLMGLLIFMVGLFVIAYYVNTEALRQTQKEVSLLNSLDQQKNIAIKKLFKKMDMTRRDLYNTRKDLDLTKKDLGGVTDELKGLKGKLGDLSK